MAFFSIIVPTYNRAGFISATVSSLLSQTYTDFEIIVVDDGSTDDTEMVVKKIADSRVHYFKKENGERGIARNFGTQKSCGQYLNFFDSDDLAYPDHLQKAFELIQLIKSPELFHLNYDIRKSSGQIVKAAVCKSQSINKDLIRENFLSTNGVFLRRDIAVAYPFPEDRRMSVTEDWVLWLQLAARYKIHSLEKVTSAYLDHDERSIKDWNVEKIIVRDKLMIEYLLQDPEFIKYYKKNLRRFVADRYTFFMLVLAINKRRKETLTYAFKAIGKDPLVVLRRRFIASILKLL